jgi:hypothetical protein
MVVDGDFGTAPFLDTPDELRLKVVARLKRNLPELRAAAQKRFESQPPSFCFEDGQDQVEVWDAEDFDPWESLPWTRVRVLGHRQTKPSGEVM